jgi:hypothetical protein
VRQLRTTEQAANSQRAMLAMSSGSPSLFKQTFLMVVSTIQPL